VADFVQQRCGLSYTLSSASGPVQRPRATRSCGRCGSSSAGPRGAHARSVSAVPVQPAQLIDRLLISRLDPEVAALSSVGSSSTTTAISSSRVDAGAGPRSRHPSGIEPIAFLGFMAPPPHSRRRGSTPAAVTRAIRSPRDARSHREQHRATAMSMMPAVQNGRPGLPSYASPSTGPRSLPPRPENAIASMVWRSARPCAAWRSRRQQPRAEAKDHAHQQHATQEPGF
jgi:hypothetical protein